MQGIFGYGMLAIGFFLMVIEMYIPGFGAAGITGTILMIAGVWIAANSVTEALILIAIVAALLCVAFSIMLHSVSKGRFSRSKLVLNDVSGQAKHEDLAYFAGKTGTAKSSLRPAGIGEFDGVRLNVVTEGDFIKEGTAIRVERVEGNKIIVQEII